MRRLPLAIPAAILLVACQSYGPKPLPPASDLARAVPAVTRGEGASPPPGPLALEVAPGDELDLAKVTLLALTNNPDLRSARATANIAVAQLDAARLFADPQLSLSDDHPTRNVPGVIDGVAIGLSYDVGSLVVRGPLIDVARAERDRARLALVWQEWLTASQARLLFVRTLALRRQADIRALDVRLYEEQYRRLTAALGEGGVSSIAAAGALASLRDSSRQLGEVRRLAERAGRDLRLVLGLAPEASLALKPLPEELPPPIDVVAVRRALASLPSRRPDLLGLAAGYAAQEANVRRAIVAQFPAVSIGIRRAQDTAGVETVGFSAGITLPIFNRNRGNIAISKATRERLYQEYQARLDASASEASALAADGSLLDELLRNAVASLPELEATALAARSALARGDIDGFTYVGLETTANAKRLEVAQFRQALLEQRIALQTLLAGDPLVERTLDPVASR
ncbi:MAG: TolC family protein [Burkholderiales bacterium]|nr:TolC family protein [Burkholderiales bacterium]